MSKTFHHSGPRVFRKLNSRRHSNQHLPYSAQNRHETTKRERVRLRQALQAILKA